jgi:DNA (cytosine-5)-methyltransferase 1
MKRSSNDPRNRLYLQYLRALNDIKPDYFIAENVRGILSLENGKVFKKIINDFSNSGYLIQHKLVNASSFGVPQNRYRVIIFGTKKEKKLIPKFSLKPSHGKGLKPLVSIGQALKGIPEPEEKHSLKNHIYSQFQLKNNGFINHRKVDASKPAPTVTARGDTRGGAMINHHPKNHRRLSVRETAIIQTFPKNFEFIGSMTSTYMQIGNAVPVLLAEKIGLFLKDIENGKAEFLSRAEILEVN